MKKTWLFGAALMAATAVLVPMGIRANADETKPAAAAPAKHARYMGKVTAVDATAKTITLDTKKNGSMTFTVSDTTKIKVNGADAKLEDIKTDKSARVNSADGKAADEIVQGKKAAPSPAVPAPAK